MARVYGVEFPERPLMAVLSDLLGNDYAAWAQTSPAPGQPGRSEAQEARDGYLKLSAEDQKAVVAFLKSLVNFSIEDR